MAVRKIVGMGEEVGMVPPQAIELEEAVLGAIIMVGASFYDVSTILKPESFYKDQHQKIYQAIYDLATMNSAIDMLTVTEQLRKRKQLEEIGGPMYIAQLTSRIASTQHVVDHAEIIREMYIKREVIRINRQSLDKAFDEEVEPKELIADLESELYSITAISHKKEPKSVTSGIREAIVNMEAYKKGQIVGVTSGIKDMDELTGGWQKQDLIILAGRPSQGKTQAGIKFIHEACLSGKSCLFFSLEMSLAQISTRLILMETGMGSDDIRRGLTDGEWMMVDSAIHNIEKLKLFIDDTPALPIMECISKIRRAKIRHGVDLVVIDYLQLMKGIKTKGDYNRDLEIGSITSALKSIAKELDIPIILLSQLNRSVEMRASKRPQLSDLRESGNIEQDADLVIFIYRGEVYHKPDPDLGIEADVGEFIFEKHRNGKTGTVFFRKNPNFSKIYNY